MEETWAQNHTLWCWAAAKWGILLSHAMLRILRRRYPVKKIDFWEQEATRDFEEALCGEGKPLNWRISWDKPQDKSKKGRLRAITKAAEERNFVAGEVDLVINCDGLIPNTDTKLLVRTKVGMGASLSADGRIALEWGDATEQRFLADKDWDSIAFLERYSKKFTSNYIAELLCRMAYLEPTQSDLAHIDLPWEVPAFTTPPILIHTTATRAAKIWPMKKWDQVLDWCASKGVKVGLVGAPPKRQKSESIILEMKKKN